MSILTQNTTQTGLWGLPGDPLIMGKWWIERSGYEPPECIVHFIMLTPWYVAIKFNSFTMHHFFFQSKSQSHCAKKKKKRSVTFREGGNVWWGWIDHRGPSCAPLVISHIARHPHLKNGIYKNMHICITMYEYIHIWSCTLKFTVCCNFLFHLSGHPWLTRSLMWWGSHWMEGIPRRSKHNLSPFKESLMSSTIVGPIYIRD